jgi:uncharacterized protein YbjT (DUF2867 family)
MKKALLFGASGFVGSYLLQELLKAPEYDQVTIVVRKPLPAEVPAAQTPKLKTLIGDLQSLPSLKNQLVADDVFIALGTTRKHTPDTKEYYKVDHDYPVLAAKLAKENGATAVFIVSAVGANENSNLFYVKTKGETERDIKALGFARTHIFQPSMIVGERKEERPLEKTLIKFWGLLDPFFVSGLDRYRGIDAKVIAQAMLRAAREQVETPESEGREGENRAINTVKTYRWHEMTR